MAVPVFQEERRVNLGGVVTQHVGEPGDTDMKIVVESTEDGELTFEVVQYDLSLETWSGVEDDEDAEVALGWMETETIPVVYGVIEDTGTAPETPDATYTAKGKDKSQKLLQPKIDYNRSWNSVDPGQIAIEIARQEGLSPGVVESAGAMDGYWSVQEDRSAANWLEEVKQEAQTLTDEQWTVYAEAGKLFFMRKQTDRTSGFELNPETNLLNIGKSTGNSTKSDGSEELEFESILEPSIHRDMILEVNSVRHSGAYKVVTYTHESSTVGEGNHHTTGTLVDVSADYDLSLPGRANVQNLEGTASGDGRAGGL